VRAINALFDKVAGFISCFAGFLEGDGKILADCKEILATGYADTGTATASIHSV
jgi:hypothetical protein